MALCGDGSREDGVSRRSWKRRERQKQAVRQATMQWIEKEEKGDGRLKKGFSASDFASGGSKKRPAQFLFPHN